MPDNIGKEDVRAAGLQQVSLSVHFKWGEEFKQTGAVAGQQKMGVLTKRKLRVYPAQLEACILTGPTRAAAGCTGARLATVAAAASLLVDRSAHEL